MVNSLFSFTAVASNSAHYIRESQVITAKVKVVHDSTANVLQAVPNSNESYEKFRRNLN